MTTLFGRRVLLRPLEASDFTKWQEVRRRNVDWLTHWEPERLPGQPDVVEDKQAFSVRCSARQRERQLGTGYGFGIFMDGTFAGEMNLSSVQRGPFQSSYVGYWIDEALAGQGYTPEAFVVACRFAFEELHLHRVQAAIVPRNTPSRRVVEKLKLREEGIAERYLEINGIWEDHVRYAITAEEWDDRSEELVRWDSTSGVWTRLETQGRQGLDSSPGDLARRSRARRNRRAGPVRPAAADSVVDASDDPVAIDPGGGRTGLHRQ